MASCTYCGKSLANNDDAENHAGECPVMNGGGPLEIDELAEMDEENPDWYWDVSFLSREEEDE